MISIMFAPELSQVCRGLLLARCEAFHRALEEAHKAGRGPWHTIEDFRAANRSLGNQPTVDQLKLLVSAHVIADLAAQGWMVSVSREGVQLEMDDSDETLRSKDHIRQCHLLERDAQLREPAAREFVRSMERRRLTASGWQSIFSLMRNGCTLAADLRSAAAASNEQERDRLLGELIRPYLQFVRSTERCEHTGLLLTDIWRYFRHTWVTAYHSVPGRSMMVLVRDAAVRNHPVIGIAALGSAVVQQTVRDEWIGWSSGTGMERLLRLSPRGLVKWVFNRLDECDAGIYTTDLVRSGLVTRGELSHPSLATVNRLRQAAKMAISEHRLHPQKSVHKTAKDENLGSVADWQLRTETSLFRSKRCKVLATLLEIRRTLNDAFASAYSETDFAEVFKRRDVRNILFQLIRLSKGERIGVNMMDITVCGAVAPYNVLLGGKLVCLLLCSPEVGKEYAARYTKQPSLIASCMKGAPIFRIPELVFLGTTSLYGQGSSQYNRVKVPVEAIGGVRNGCLEYRELGLSVGYGSFHLSDETVSVMNVLLARVAGGRRVNSILGEGANPLMRKIREALDIIGIASDSVLRHGNQRIVYGVSLVSNLQDYLLGLEETPRFLLPQQEPRAVSECLAEFWRRRWLRHRIQRPEVLDQVGQHGLDFPLTHGARVRLPIDDPDAHPRLL